VQTGVWILGSCVTRDALAEDSEGFELIEYWARTSLGSAFSERSVDSVEFAKIASPFQRRMVEADVKKLLPSRLENAKSDLYVVDFIDERFDLYEAPGGGLCTLSNELLSSGFACEGGRVIASGSDEFYSLWERGWRKLVSTLSREWHLDRLRIHKAYWSTSNEDGSGFPTYPNEHIVAANAFLDRLYARVTQDVPRHQVVECPRNLIVGAAGHRWGASPFHYVTPYYQEFMGNLRETVTASRTGRAAPAPRALVEASMPQPVELRDIELTANPAWLDLRELAGSTVAVRAIVRGGSGVRERRALITMDFGAGHRVDLAELGLARSHDPNVGAYRYLATGHGAHETSFSLKLPDNTDSLRLGVRTWWAEDWMKLETLSITETASATSTTTLLSVDVEALPGRSSGSQTEELIYGNIAGARGRGIARICDIFADFGVRATFFVDYATCAVYGDAEIFRAAEYIRSRGQDVQLHMHSEILVRHLGWHPGAAFFDELDVSLAHRVLDYGITKFEQNLGSRPKIFRPGAMKKSKAMYLAAEKLDLKAISAIFRGYESTRWPAFGHDSVVQWSNGIREIPLDLALDPLQAWQPFETKVQAFRNERPNRSVSLLIHSTSLLFRERSGDAVFTNFHEPYEAQLIRYLEMLAPKTRFITHSDALDEATGHPSIPIEWADAAPPATTVTVAPTPKPAAKAAATPTATDAVALTTNSDPPPVLIPVTLDESAIVDTCAPPTALPVRLAPGQTLHTVGFAQGAAPGTLGYIVTGYKAYFVSQRGSLPTGNVLRELVQKIFDRHPLVSKVIVEWVLNDFSEFPALSPRVARKTFVLDLPESFERYRLEFISRELRRDIEREERRANEELSGVQFEVIEGAPLTPEALDEAACLVEAHLTRKDPTSDWRASKTAAEYDLYSARGFIARLMSSGRPIAVALCLRHKRDECYLMAAAHDERLTKQSLGKICLYRLVEALIGQGVRTFHMGGGDFGYKGRFGATERALRTIEIDRTDALSPEERVELALRAGAKPCGIEREINRSLEDVLGARFEATVGVDFDGILENRDIGTGPQSQRYQATIGEAFRTLLETIRPTADDVFVDVGSGKGKMLYYAAQLGFERCIGIELSSALIPLAESNLRRLGLSASVELLQRDASRLSPADISAGTVFYLYNPFSEEILSKFLESVANAQALRRRPITVVYCNARHPNPFKQHGFNLCREFKRGVAGWRYDDSAIYALP